MIHLIMVLSAITLPPLHATMDSSSPSSSIFRSLLQANQKANIRLTSSLSFTEDNPLEDSVETLGITKSQLLVDTRRPEPASREGDALVQLSAKNSSRDNVSNNNILSSNGYNWQQFHHQGKKNVDHNNNGRYMEPSQEPVLKSSPHHHHQLFPKFLHGLRNLRLVKGTVLKKKRTTFKRSSRPSSYKTTRRRKSLSRTIRVKNPDVNIMTSQEFDKHKSTITDNNGDEPVKIQQNLVKDILSNLGDKNHTGVVLRATISNPQADNIDCDRVKRSTNDNSASEDIGSRRRRRRGSDSLQEASTSIRHSPRKREDHSDQTISSADDVNATSSSSSSNGTTTKRGKRRRRGRRRHRQSKDLSLFIDERQVKLFSGYMMEIYVIHDGRVLPYILDPNFEKHLPVIPFEVQNVNFTWQAGRKRYYYTFDRLYSHDPSILEAPVVSLPSQGRIPRKPKVFTVNINCSGNASGIAAFDIGLLIQTRRGKPMPGTPLRLKLRKECTEPSKHSSSYGADPECDQKCKNGGVCDTGRKCQCPEGYMGPYCNTALCYPQCMNGGTCTTPGRCSCPPGYQGRHCEGGICRDKCENGGKCIQKDTCSCPRGYYGNRCEFSKCVIPCINGGRCRNVNKCRCPHGFAGDHCEVVTGQSTGTTATARCSRKCRHGTCRGMDCVCQEGFTGRWCKRRGTARKRIWM